ncbi:MAG: ThiF family adenylyltransferase [Candidatus Bathyarchaeia archaeon]
MAKIKIKFPSILSKFTNGERNIEVSALNLNEAFEKLEERFGLTFKQALFNQDGSLKRTINVLLNGRNVRSLNFQEVKLNDGDEVVVIPIVGGGSTTLLINELERYSRQIALRKIGLEGQRKLKEAKVSIVGVGGLGCVSAVQLAAMGVGYLKIIDQDVIEVTNLHRQLLYDVESIGYPKVEVAEKKLKLLNPNIDVEAEALTINRSTVFEAIKDVDLVIDGLDRIEPRYAVNEACIKLKIPYIFGSAIEMYGSASTIIPGETGCLECFLGKISDENLPTCETVGVFPPVLSIIASIQTSEAVNLILKHPPALANKLLFLSLENSINLDIFPIKKSDFCSTCSGKYEKEEKELNKYLISELCGKNAFMVSTTKLKSYDLDHITEVLIKKFKVNFKSNFSLTFNYSSHISVTFMKNGNMLIKGASSKKEAEEVYNSIMNLIELS